ncbi:MAG: xylose isomerase [Acidobacteria bacterium]|nr:MAG: xylose isomerase [Acidobacteriota bacterium]
MSSKSSRREFIAGLTAVAGSWAIPPAAFSSLEPLYPPMDLSHFDTPISAAPAEITWGGNDRRAIEDIAALGFSGIQLRSNLLSEFPNPTDVRNLLEQHHLTMVALSSGGVRIEGSDDTSEIDRHVQNAKYTHSAGGLYLQVTDKKPKGSVNNGYKKLGRLLTEIGKRSADLGVRLGYHNHMGSMGQSPEEVDRVLDAADPRYVKLELDIAHYLQGGGDPAKAIQQYHDRLLFLHIKDVESTPNRDSADGNGFRFVELGRGRVDLPAVFKALQDVRYRGWAVVELDSVPDPSRSPTESARISKNYLCERLGISI